MTPDLNFTFEELKTRHKKYFVAAFSLSFFCALLPVAPIVYMRTIFGPVISSDSISYLTWLTILLIFVLAVNAILDWIRDRIIFSGVISFVNQVEERVFVTTFENETKDWSRGADTISRLRVFRNFLTSNITTAIMDTPFSIILLIAIFFIHPLMGFFSLLGALIAFSIGLLIEKKIQPVTDKAMEQNSESRKMLTEFFRDSSTLMTMGNLDRAYSRWQEINKKYLVFQARASKTQAFGSSISKVVMMVQGSMILGVGTLLTLLEIMPSSMAGNLILAKFIGALAIRPTMHVVMGWSQVVQFREVYKSLKSFLKDFKVSKESMELPNPEGHLVANKVDYIQEASERKILDNINFSCNPGSITAILGPSGSGKSTLCRLLVGIKSPTKGAIFLDNVPIDKWDKNSVGSHIGYSPQEHQLFEDEIAINISRYQLPDETKLKEACYLIGIPEYYQAFVEDMRLKVESDSSNLSGGMKQKISLARAFYGDPKLIVLDEPTSMLDQETKELLLGALRKFREKGSTIIIATHDKAILKTADFVLAIHGGRQKFFEEKHTLMKKLSEQMKK